MVIKLLAHCAFTPAGNPFAPATLSFEMPVAPAVVCVILVKAVLIHKVCVEDAGHTMLLELLNNIETVVDLGCGNCKCLNVTHDILNINYTGYEKKRN